MTKDLDESWFGAQRLIRFMDQTETQVRSLSMTSVRAQSTMESKLSLTVLGLVSELEVGPGFKLRSSDF